MKHGYGVIEFNDGSVYEGNLHYDFPDGKCRFRDALENSISGCITPGGF